MSINSIHPLISSVQNERVKRWSSLLDKKHRMKNQQFLVEGVHLIQEACKAKVNVRTIVYDDQQGIPKELTNLSSGSSDIEWVRASKAVMAKCSDTDSPPPVFAVIDFLSLETDITSKNYSLVIALDCVRDPGNVGTIIRSADAAGADAVILGKGCADLYNGKTIRSTMGSLFHLPVIEGDLTILLPEAQTAGNRLIGTSLQAEINCYQYNWNQPTWVLMGNEANGLSEDIRNRMDECVIIPMAGEAESLNVAMASTMLLYEALRQRRYCE